MHPRCLSAVLISLLIAGSAARAQQFTWQATGPFKWSTPNNWSPTGPPPSASNVLISTYPGPFLDIDATIGSLTLQNRTDVHVAGNGTPYNLTVTGTTTIANPATPPSFNGGEIVVDDGSICSLGTLANFANGQLTGGYNVFDSDYLTKRQPSVLQWRGANVIDNRANVYFLGDDAYMRDQDSGLDAFRNLAVNNGYFYREDAPSQATVGSLINNAEFYIDDSFSPARSSYTINGSLTNNADAYLESYGNAEIIVKANVVNHATGSGNGLYVFNQSSAVAGETLIRVEKDLMNDGQIVVTGVSGHPARLEVLGSATNTGELILDGVGTANINGVLTLAGGRVGMTGNTGFETFIMTAKRIDHAAGVEWGARGTVFADLVGRGVLAPGASPGTLTINGNITWLDPAELRIEIGGSAPGTQHDQVVQHTQTGGSGVKLGGTLSVTFVNGFGSNVQNSDFFTIVTSDKPIAGQFSNVASGGLVPTSDGSGSFRVDYAGTNIVRLGQFQAATPPVITSIPTSGVPSSVVTILGSGFFGTTDVKFNGTSAPSFTIVTDTQLSATVPVGATSGAITVMTNHGNATSTTNFTVLEDSDGDGMSDSFEVQYFGNATAGNPNDDSGDGDGMTNLDEFRAGTNPFDANSVLRVKQIRRQGNDVIIVFPSASNKRYQLQASATPNFAFPIRLTILSAGAADPAQQVTDASAGADLVRFYRVVVLP